MASPNKKPRAKPSWVHHGLSRCREAVIINLSFLHLGWMASMLSLAAWRREWTWSRKWSLSVPGLGEPPRRSLSPTAASSSRRRVSSGHGRGLISCCNFNARVRVKEALSSVMAQSATSLCRQLIISESRSVFLLVLQICVSLSSGSN